MLELRSIFLIFLEFIILYCTLNIKISTFLGHMVTQKRRKRINLISQIVKPTKYP